VNQRVELFLYDSACVPRLEGGTTGSRDLISSRRVGEQGEQRRCHTGRVLADENFVGFSGHGYRRGAGCDDGAALRPALNEGGLRSHPHE
jgi:hypothetical protein